jgi:hypothetical protein
MDKEKFIRAFENIRDIPYRIPVRFSEPDNCCSGKAVRLRKFFELEGLEVRYRVVGFKWSKLNLPGGVLQVSHLDDCTHVYVEVKLGDRWVNIDPTWDSKIGSVLPIAEWDGATNTILAVPVEKYYNDEESEKLMIPDETEFNKDIEINGEFYRKINEWLESARISTNSK